MKKTNSLKNIELNPRRWKSETRRLALWLGVSIIMNSPEPNNFPLLNISQIQSDLSIGVEEVKNDAQALKKINTSTQNLTPEEKLLEEQNKIKIDELRQKLEQLPDK